MASAIKDPYERKFRILIRTSERSMREKFKELIDWMRRNAKLAEIEALLSSGKVAEAFKLFDRAAAIFAEQTAAAYVTSGKSVTAQISKEIKTPMAFERANVRAAEYLRRDRLRLIRQFTEQQRKATRQALVFGTELAENPRQMAKRFRDSIGLTSSQTRAVESYRAALQANSVTARNRELSSGTVDRSVESAAAGRRPPLTDVEIDRAADLYRKNMIDRRAVTIARTEALRAVHEGGQEAWKQAAESGDVDPDEIVRIWRTARDARVRDFDTGDTSHVTMEGQERSLTEPFESGQGALLMYPGDRSAPPNDVINCRCVVVTRLRPRATKLDGFVAENRHPRPPANDCHKLVVAND